MADLPDTLNAALDDYLCAAGRQRWSWGEVDCFLFVAAWVERVTGTDCAAEYRGAYATGREARRLIRLNGGPVAFAGSLLARAGCLPTETPKPGDVALVRARFSATPPQTGTLTMQRNLQPTRIRMVDGPVGAICRRPGLWTVKPADASGLVFAAFPVIQAWALPHA